MEFANRLRLLHLYEARIRSASRLRSLTCIPLSTIRDNLKRFGEGRDAERAPGSGRDRILKPNDRRRVAQLAVHHRGWPSVRIRNEAMERGTRKVADRTIRLLLKRRGYIKFVSKKIPILTRALKVNRVNWCEEHLNDDWDSTIFSDKIIFQFYRSRAKQWTKHRKPRKPAPAHGPQVTI